VSEALVAKESLAEGCGWCKGTADARSDLAVSKARCMVGVQGRVSVLEVASVSFSNPWQKKAIEIEHAQKFLQ
jgi:hypothetical protein